MAERSKSASNESASSKKGRGRPATGTAKTATQRAKEFDEALLSSGGRILSRVRLSHEAANALAGLTERLGSDRQSIEKALIEYHKYTSSDDVERSEQKWK